MMLNPERIGYFQGKTSKGYVTVEMLWQESDPFAIKATFHFSNAEGGKAVWHFALDLLAKGEGGHGAIQVWHRHGRTSLILNPFADKSFMVTFKTKDVERYLRRIPNKIPTQRISKELDKFLDSLLAG